MTSSIRKRKTSGNRHSNQSSLGQSSNIMAEEGYYIQEVEYNVEKILAMKEERGITYYQVKWEGYPESESTWEPLSHLQNVLDMIEDFQMELIRKDSLKEFEETKQVRQSRQFEPIKIFEKPNESQESKGLFEDDSVFRKRRAEERMNGEDREIREMFLGMEDIGGHVTRSPHLSVNLFPAKIIAKKDVMEVEENPDKKDKDIEREKRREKGSLLREEAKQRSESKIIKESSQKKSEPKHDQQMHEENVHQRKSGVENNKTSVIQEKMIIEEQGNKEKNVVSEMKKSIVKKHSINKSDKENVNGGSFKLNDKPKQILTIKERKKGGLWFLVEWQRREDGTKPDNSYVENEEMKANDPYFLLSFYESKIVVLPKEKDKENLDLKEIKSLVNEKYKSTPKSKSHVHTIDTDDEDELYTSATKPSKVIVTSSGVKNKEDKKDGLIF